MPFCYQCFHFISFYLHYYFVLLRKMIWCQNVMTNWSLRFDNNLYLHSFGFSVCSSLETRDKNGVKCWKYFVCSKEGYHMIEKIKSRVITDKSRRSRTREGCIANAIFKWVEGGKFDLMIVIHMHLLHLWRGYF